jgi:hypothetical protein
MIPSAKSEKRDSAATAAAAEERLQCLLIDSRRRHPRAEPIDGKHTGREEQAPT